MTSPTPPRRRWFRFSLRTLFVAVTIFGVWLGVQAKWIRDRRVFLSEHDHAEIYVLEASRIPSAPGALRIFGERGVWAINTSGMSEGEIAAARRLFPEARLEVIPK